MRQLPYPKQTGWYAGREREPALVQVQARGASREPLVAAPAACRAGAAHQHQVVARLAQVRTHLHLQPDSALTSAADPVSTHTGAGSVPATG